MLLVAPVNCFLARQPRPPPWRLADMSGWEHIGCGTVHKCAPTLDEVEGDAVDQRQSDHEWSRAVTTPLDAGNRILIRVAAWCLIPIVVIGNCAIGDAKCAADVSGLRGIASVDQMSIFQSISIASSTSMPRYRTLLSIFECPSNVNRRADTFV